ncbi:hypothetical protein COW36_13120 [bacterium (Candidatus Blackallbacteria) CG17_big_fil_post_rev_8_21_14_2_50_48_46]|uniref:Uncharacterized protein n=1 Tax=bacterium (Candidatus Blackallbacteria) CG17_big_fil_post_rev_8_21_14_2_50_48_46 TaxID=2014261 RepID=A0A2M7G4B9_9BACT|nr:MAG: hypothetical protein COW36_13120 [bacterium (Candidatus Blackallbacteria) CG17_big_fil_post_rev_8_21_14_2_50_48_46]
MEIFKQDHPQINLERDWAAISGKADQKGPDQFTMAPATQSYFNQAPEEVSDYGETNPGEDFAESYRMFMSQPEELIKRAPTKFLVLNALNGRFSPEQIQTQFGPYQDKLDQAWKKIQGQTGAKFHLSAPMVELMNKTYGGTLGKPADSSDLQSFTTAALDKAGKTVAGTGALYKNPPLSPERLQSLKNLQHPALSQEQLKATNNALAKLISQVQTGGGNLDATGIQTLLGNDYQALPEGFKAMLSDPNSFISQYLNQPDHVGRSASPGWVQTEALSQMVTGYENLNSNYVRLAGLSSEGGGGGLKGLFMFKSKGGGPALLPVTRELNAYLENYNRLRQPAVPVPDSEALKAKVSEILSQTQTPTEFMARFLQEMGLQ